MLINVATDLFQIFKNNKQFTKFLYDIEELRCYYNKSVMNIENRFNTVMITQINKDWEA